MNEMVQINILLSAGQSETVTCSGLFFGSSEWLVYSFSECYVWRRFCWNFTSKIVNETINGD